MEGTAKRQVNAEEMLAELKRALKSSTPAPNAPPPFASTAPKSSSPGRDSRRSQIDKGSDRPVRAKANRSIGHPADLQKSTTPSFQRWTLTAGVIALAVAAVVGASFALMNKAPDPAERAPSVAATAALVRSQNEQNSQALERLPLVDRGQPAGCAFASRQLGSAARRQPSFNKQRLGFSPRESGSRCAASYFFWLGIGGRPRRPH